MATDVERLAVLIEANTKSYENAMKKLQSETDRRLAAMEKRFKKAGTQLEQAFREASFGVNRVLGTIGIGLGARELQRLVDQYTAVRNALKVVGLEGEHLDRVYDRLFQSAQKNAAPLQALSTLYGRAALVQKELNVSSEELLQFTDRIALALRVSGQSAEQSSGALLQLSQALGSGVVRAEEFNSILEGALPIAQAAAEGLEDAGGSVAKLRQLIVDGKVSSEAFFRAFQAGSATLEERAGKMQMTIAQAFTQFQNVLIDSVGKLNETTGASQEAIRFLRDLGDGVKWIADNIEKAKQPFNELILILRQIDEAASSAARWIGKVTGLNQVGPALGLDNRPTSNMAFAIPNEMLEQQGAKPAAVKPVKLSDFPVTGKSDKGNTVGVDSFERALASAQKRIELLNAETQTIGLNTAARERAKIVAELETAAKNANAAAGMKNTEVTDAQRAKINEMADAMQAASQRNYELTQAFEAQNSVMQFAGEQTIDLIKTIGGTAEERANALKNVLNQVIDAMLKATLLGEGPLAGLFGTKSASGGVGGIFGILAKTFAGGFASGGTIPAGKWGVVGERGPEIVTSGARPLSVTPNMGGGPQQIVNNNYTVHAPGATPEAMALAFKEIRRLRAEVPTMSVAAVSRARELSPGRVR